MIWHLRLAGFQAGRQKNPSGAISDDKLTIICGRSGTPMTSCRPRRRRRRGRVHFDEVPFPIQCRTRGFLTDRFGRTDRRGGKTGSLLLPIPPTLPYNNQKCRKTASRFVTWRARPPVSRATWRTRSIVSKLKPIPPTVLIYNCTWVCDARCEMCNNWKHGDRKSDMTLEQLEPVMATRSGAASRT